MVVNNNESELTHDEMVLFVAVCKRIRQEQKTINSRNIELHVSNVQGHNFSVSGLYKLMHSLRRKGYVAMRKNMFWLSPKGWSYVDYLRSQVSQNKK